MSQTIKSRILLKTGTTSEWKLATTFKPLKGEVCIYTDYISLGDSYIPGIKIGDGNTLIDELPFINDNYIANSEIDELF